MAAMRADCSEAMISHVKLAELHLTRCIGSELVPTDECVDCTLKNICDNA